MPEYPIRLDEGKVRYVVDPDDSHNYLIFVANQLVDQKPTLLEAETCVRALRRNGRYAWDAHDHIGGKAAARRRKHQAACDHKFIDSTHCLKCGWVPPTNITITKVEES